MKKTHSVIGWPSVVNIFETESSEEFLKECVDLALEVNPACLTGTQPPWINLLQTHPDREVIEGLCRLIDEGVRLYLEDYRADEPYELDCSLSVWTCGTGDLVYPHHHNPYDLVGVFYPIVEASLQDSNVLRLHDPQAKRVRWENRSDDFFEDKFFHHIPRTGELVMFPAHLIHSTTPFLGDGIRVNYLFQINVQHGRSHTPVRIIK